MRTIVEQVKDRGPGGHILTGPVFVEAPSLATLEVKVLSIDLPIEHGYNRCAGFIRENCAQGTGPRIIRMDRKRMIGHFAPGIEIPLRPFFGSMGVAPPPARGRVSSNPPDIHAGNLDNKELVAGTTLLILYVLVRCSKLAMAMRRKAMASPIRPRSKHHCEGECG